MRQRRVALSGCVALAFACGPTPPPEPPYERQLYMEQGCFMHIDSGWRHVEAAELRGAVRGDCGDDCFIQNAVVYARRWPRGTIATGIVDERGHFDLSRLGPGLFEVAVCAPGWNSWRGTVRADSRARGLSLRFTLNIGL